MDDVTRCPRCGELMEKGFVATWYMFWTDKKQEIFWKTPPRNDVVIKPGVFHIYDRSVEAYRCKKCKIVLFSYGDVSASMTPPSFLKQCVSCNRQISIGSEYCPVCGAKQKESAKG